MNLVVVVVVVVCVHGHVLISDIAIFVLKKDVKLQLTNSWSCAISHSTASYHSPAFVVIH